ncbi:molecular chaperone HchA (Hsp31) [Vibrio cholerae]|nr:molecular chaperone HchA (Hsp31) [Vibrio cholerae]
MDAQTPSIGYMPGHLTWKFGEQLQAIGNRAERTYARCRFNHLDKPTGRKP